MKTGKLIVITGPSGVGKGTLVRSLLTRHPELYLSVSATTRTPRVGEIEGRDYYFMSRSRFLETIEAGQLLEWAEYAGNFYGTPRAPIEQQIAGGKFVLLEIEVVGATKIKQTFPEALRIFILPPAIEELERRLRTRATDSEVAIAKRLAQAKAEMMAAEAFDVQIINDNLETALSTLEGAIFSQQEAVNNGRDVS